MQIQSSTKDMIRELKEVKSVFSNCERPEQKVYSRDLEQQAQLDLAMSLQMSLDIDWVINKFMEHIHSYFLFDGFAYSYEESIVSIQSARQKGHSCSYNLKIEDLELGKLVVYRGRKFVESELVLLENLLSILIYPLRNSIQFKKASLMAHCDALTGVRNRSTFDESLEREISLSQRYRQDISLLVIDIDFFKKVNDTYGHHIGDLVLTGLVCLIKEHVRACDIVARYGGEEFAVVLPGVTLSRAREIAERLRNAVENDTHISSEEGLKVTVSIGIDDMSSLDGCDTIAKDIVRKLLDNADQALYKAKDSGRNKVVVYSEIL